MRMLRNVAHRLGLEFFGGKLSREGVLGADALHKVGDIRPADEALFLSVLAGDA